MKQQEEVLETLRLLEPRLQSLTVLVEREAMIYGDIGVSKLVPLPLMGEGMNRLLSIVLAIANALMWNNFNRRDRKWVASLNID